MMGDQTYTAQQKMAAQVLNTTGHQLSDQELGALLARAFPELDIRSFGESYYHHTRQRFSDIQIFDQAIGCLAASLAYQNAGGHLIITAEE